MYATWPTDTRSKSHALDTLISQRMLALLSQDKHSFSNKTGISLRMQSTSSQQQSKFSNRPKEYLFVLSKLSESWKISALFPDPWYSELEGPRKDHQVQLLRKWPIQGLNPQPLHYHHHALTLFLSEIHILFFFFFTISEMEISNIYLHFLTPKHFRTIETTSLHKSAEAGCGNYGVKIKSQSQPASQQLDILS